MGNAVSYVNPLFTFFDIVPNPNKRFQTFKNGLICLEMFSDEGFKNNKIKSKFGQLIDGTLYGDYVVENKPLEDTEDFLRERGSDRYKYICTFKTEDFEIAVWDNLTMGGLYCDELVDGLRRNKFAVQISDLSEGYLYLKKIKPEYDCIYRVLKANANGTLFYSTQEVKKIMQERVLPFI